MIARPWHGWTKREDADGYEDFLKRKLLPGLKALEGYLGGYVLRHDGDNESEFVGLNLFDSLDAVRRFAGPEYTTPVFGPEAKLLLSRIEDFATRYEVRASPVSGSTVLAVEHVAHRVAAGCVQVLARVLVAKITAGLFACFGFAATRAAIGEAGLAGTQLELLTANGTGFDRKSHTQIW